MGIPHDGTCLLVSRSIAASACRSFLKQVFLQVGFGEAVLVEPQEGGWWAGQVIHCESRARCSANSFSQIADVDGLVRIVTPNLVIGIVRKGYGELPLAASETDRPRKTLIRFSCQGPQAHREVELGFLKMAC